MQQEPQKRRSLAGPAIALISTVVLAVGSCFGFLSTINDTDLNWWTNFLFDVFWACVLAFFVALIWLSIRAVRNRSAGRPDEQ